MAEMQRRGMSVPSGGAPAPDMMTQRRAAALEPQDMAPQDTGDQGVQEIAQSFGLKASSPKIRRLLPILDVLEQDVSGHAGLMASFASFLKTLQKAEQEGNF